MVGEPARRVEARRGAKGGDGALDPLVDRVRRDLEDLRDFLGVVTRQYEAETRCSISPGDMVSLYLHFGSEQRVVHDPQLGTHPAKYR